MAEDCGCIFQFCDHRARGGRKTSPPPVVAEKEAPLASEEKEGKSEPTPPEE